MATKKREGAPIARENRCFGSTRTEPKTIHREMPLKRNMKTCKKQASGQQRKAVSNKHSRPTKVNSEDKDYLAHGTGIPRYGLVT